MKRAISLEHVDAAINRWQKRLTRAVNMLDKLRRQRTRLDRKLKAATPPPLTKATAENVVEAVNAMLNGHGESLPPPPKPKKPGGAHYARLRKERGQSPAAVLDHCSKLLGL